MFTDPAPTVASCLSVKWLRLFCQTLITRAVESHDKHQLDYGASRLC